MIEKLPNNLIEFIKTGECTTIEYKKAKSSLPSSLFESVCSMLNRNGGHIFLGVNDDSEVIGVYKDYTRTMKKEFVDLCNNPEKIFPTVHLDMKEYIYEEKHILYIYVHESSDVHKTANKIFDRNEDGDFDITNNTTLISNLYIRKRSTYIENKIYPFATMNDLRVDLIEEARKMASNRTSNHPWAKMSNEEMLRSAGLYEKNLETGKEGFNLACLLLFGKDDIIASALSYYKTDAILKVKDTERYDDRDDIRTNLLDSYDRLTDFIKKHLNDKFYIEDDQRINVRDVIARELCANLLIHREYSNPYPAKLVITKDSIITENANKPRTIGYIDLNNYSPYPKNPKIASFFKEIGLADELGSGIKKIAKYTKIYSGGGEPLFKDDEIFVATVPLTNKSSNSNFISNNKLKELILDFIKKNSDGRTRQEINDFIYPQMSDILEKKNSRVRTSLTYLRKKDLIENIGSDTKSIWIAK
ncbi:MAG: putative DNA binding domain-containing protein [Bacilli bacterium]|nr:putative DNA binding domain-containing protein [Bacilli bacterium]